MKAYRAICVTLLAVGGLVIAGCSRKPELPRLDEVQLPTVAAPTMPSDEEILGEPAGGTPSVRVTPRTPQPEEQPTSEPARDEPKAAGAAQVKDQQPIVMGVVMPEGTTPLGPTTMNDIDPANLLFTAYQSVEAVEYCNDGDIEAVRQHFERQYDDNLTIIQDTGKGPTRLVVGTLRTRDGKRLLALGRSPDDEVTRIRVAELAETLPGPQSTQDSQP